MTPSVSTAIRDNQWQSMSERMAINGSQRQSEACNNLEGGGAEEVRLHEVELVVDDREAAREEVDHALELR